MKVSHTLIFSLLIAVTSAAASELPVTNPTQLTAALKRARPGDSIVMADGTWKDADIVFAAKGTDGNPITLRAQTPGKVVLTGQSRLRIASQHLVVDGLWFKDGYVESGSVIEFRGDSKTFAANCRMTNCAVTDYNPTDRKTDYRWCSLYGQSNRVDHCYFAGKTHASPTLVVWVGDQPNSHRIDHNHFGPRPPLGANGGETMRIGTSEVSMNVSRTTVEDNLFERCNGEIEIISNKSCENVYRRNVFRECSGAMTLRHGNRCDVFDNLFLGNGKKNTGGVRIIGEDHRVIGNRFYDLTGKDARAALCFMNGIPNSPPSGYFQVKRALVTSNTFARCAHNIVTYASEGGTLPPVDCVITNNLIVAVPGEVGPQPTVGPAWRVD